MHKFKVHLWHQPTGAVFAVVTVTAHCTLTAAFLVGSDLHLTHAEGERDNVAVSHVELVTDGD